MKERTYRVTFKAPDIACIPPCGLGAALNALDETVRSILSRYADTARDDDKLRFGNSYVEINNGRVTINGHDDEDTEKIVAILKHYFSVHETPE
jgi:hypothetical protein